MYDQKKYISKQALLDINFVLKIYRLILRDLIKIMERIDND